MRALNEKSAQPLRQHHRDPDDQMRKIFGTVDHGIGDNNEEVKDEDQQKAYADSDGRFFAVDFHA